MARRAVRHARVVWAPGLRRGAVPKSRRQPSIVGGFLAIDRRLREGRPLGDRQAAAVEHRHFEVRANRLQEPDLLQRLD
jgi:hypothetical protein